MCACGCFLLLAVAAGIAWAVIHGLWPVAALILIVSLVLGWFGQKKIRRPNPPGAKPS
jgi:hypothetical protein